MAGVQHGTWPAATVRVGDVFCGDTFRALRCYTVVRQLPVPVDSHTYYCTYGPMVLRRCRKLLGDEQAARDAMHDVFVQVLSRADQLDDHAPSSLLFRIATNVCLNRLRTRRRRPEDGDPDLLVAIAEQTDPAARNAARSALDALFRHEPDDTALIAVLHLHDRMTLEEVAAEVGMSVSGVRKRLQKLRTKLQHLEVQP